MAKLLHKFLLAALLLCMTVCFGLFAAACDNDKENVTDPDKTDDGNNNGGNNNGNNKGDNNGDNNGGNQNNDPTADIRLGDNELSVTSKTVATLYFGVGIYTFSIPDNTNNYSFIFGDASTILNEDTTAVQYDFDGEKTTYDIEIIDEWVSDATVGITILPAFSNDGTGFTLNVTQKFDYELTYAAGTVSEDGRISGGVSNSGIAIEAFETVYCAIKDVVPGTYVMKPTLENMEYYDFYFAGSTTPEVIGGADELDDHNLTFTVTEDMIAPDGTLALRIVSTAEEGQDDASKLGKIVLARLDSEDDKEDDNGNGGFGDHDNGQNQGSEAEFATGESTDVTLTGSTQAWWKTGVAAGDYKFTVTTEQEGVDVNEFTITIAEPTGAVEAKTYSVSNGSFKATLTDDDVSKNMLKVTVTAPESLADTEVTLTIAIAEFSFTPGGPGGNFGDHDNGQDKGSEAEFATGESTDVTLTGSTQAWWKTGVAAGDYKFTVTTEQEGVDVNEFTITIAEPTGAVEAKTYSVSNGSFKATLTDDDVSKNMLKVTVTAPESLADTEVTLTIAIAEFSFTPGGPGGNFGDHDNGQDKGSEAEFATGESTDVTLTGSVQAWWKTGVAAGQYKITVTTQDDVDVDDFTITVAEPTGAVEAHVCTVENGSFTVTLTDDDVSKNMLKVTVTAPADLAETEVTLTIAIEAL